MRSWRIIQTGALGGLLLLALVSCAQTATFECSDDLQCDSGGDGICEETGMCSYPDPVCGSGRRYGGTAGEISGTCVREPQEDDKAPETDGGVLPDDAVAPTAPEGVEATVVSSTAIDLAWTASSDAVGVTRYVVERCSGSGCSDFIEAGISEAPTHSSTGLTPSTVYRFRVRASDAAGNHSAYSSIVDATTSAGPAPVVLTFNGAGNQTIPDRDLTGISQTINVADTRDVVALNVKVLITHPWRGDVRVTLSHGGVSVVLKEVDGNGEDPANDVVLDVNRTDWNGLPASGAWTLHVLDDESNDVGELESWSIAVTVE